MDYKKSGAPRPDKNTPAHREHNSKGTRKNPYDAQASKADLVARLKAAAEARKAQADD